MATPIPTSPPTFERAFDSEVSLTPGSRNHAALSIYSALSRLSDQTLREKYDELCKGSSKGVSRLNEFPNFMDEADFHLWANKNHWSLNEAILLSLGLRPDQQTITDWEAIQYDAKMNSWLLNEYRLRRKIAFKEFERGGLTSIKKGLDYCDPETCFRWLSASGFPVPSKLYEAIKRFNLNTPVQDKIAPIQPNPVPSRGSGRVILDPEEVNPKERSAMLTLIHSLGQYRGIGYDKGNPRNGAITRIHNIVIDAELSLHERTIKKYMKEAWEESERLKDKNN